MAAILPRPQFVNAIIPDSCQCVNDAETNDVVFWSFQTDYPHGIRLTTNLDNKVLITFNARNEHDRSKFVEDLKEAIAEVCILPGKFCLWSLSLFIYQIDLNQICICI